jgi:hypothetical protein
MNIFRRALHVLLSLSFAAGLGSNLLASRHRGRLLPYRPHEDPRRREEHCARFFRLRRW